MQKRWFSLKAGFCHPASDRKLLCEVHNSHNLGVLQDSSAWEAGIFFLVYHVYQLISWGHLSFHRALAFLYLKTKQTKPNKTTNMLNLLKTTGREILWAVSASSLFFFFLEGKWEQTWATSLLIGVAWPSLSFMVKSGGNSSSFLFRT